MYTNEDIRTILNNCTNQLDKNIAIELFIEFTQLDDQKKIIKVLFEECFSVNEISKTCKFLLNNLEIMSDELRLFTRNISLNRLLYIDDVTKDLK